MLTVIETELFSRLVETALTLDERLELATYLATYPNAGEVVPQSGGCRKLRWRRKNTGKRGGYRVIYYNRLTAGETYLLLIYAKAESENIPAHLLNKIRQELDNE